MAAKYDGIIFDLDGTLWNATEQIMNAWNVILSKHPEISRGKLEFSELRQCMGLVMYDIAAKLFPDETEDKRNSLMDEMCSYEICLFTEEPFIQNLRILLESLRKATGCL